MSTISVPAIEDWTRDTAARHHTLKVLRRCQYNRTITAERLGITRQTLRTDLIRWGLVANRRQKIYRGQTDSGG